MVSLVSIGASVHVALDDLGGSGVYAGLGPPGLVERGSENGQRGQILRASGLLLELNQRG
jgi:hypothetical protein